MVKKVQAKATAKKIGGEIDTSNILKGKRKRETVNYSETVATTNRTAKKGVAKQSKTTTKRGRKKKEVENKE
jgi:hypothetical protein